MIEPSLNELERDVEETRARLARNLRTLRSPTARNELTDALRHEATATKDDVLARTRSAAERRVAGLVDDIKARAAEHPAAALAIAAGVGWRVLRDPPIATALVGLGIYGLLRGGSPARTGSSDQDYLDHAVATLKQQTSAIATDVSERASAAANATGDQLREWGEEVASAVRHNGAQAVETVAVAAAAGANTLEAGLQASQAAVAEAVDNVGRAAADMQHQAAAAIEDGRAQVTRQADAAADRLQGMAHRGHGWVPSSSPDEAALERGSRSDAFNQLLLGAAGAAVAAALGVALQRRMAGVPASD
jgi:hypothetical protein